MDLWIQALWLVDKIDYIHWLREVIQCQPYDWFGGVIPSQPSDWLRQAVKQAIFSSIGRSLSTLYRESFLYTLIFIGVSQTPNFLLQGNLFVKCMDS